MYPGITAISRKNLLARNLMRMARAFPDEYNFFPKTWVLPNEALDLRQHWSCGMAKVHKRKPVYIVKPDSLSQGKGIFLSQDVEHILAVTCEQKDNTALDAQP